MIKGSKVSLEDTKHALHIYGEEIHLMIDYMFVQGVQFLTTISSKFNYRTVEALSYVNKKGVSQH